jgi:hypothetical protein
LQQAALFTQTVPGVAGGSTLGGRYRQIQGHFQTVVTGEHTHNQILLCVGKNIPYAYRKAKA